MGLAVGGMRSHTRWANRVGGAWLVWLGMTAPIAWASTEGAELAGTIAPGWEDVEWVNSEPLSLDQLRGRAVLVRWWTGPECRYCAASAPRLNSWYDTYHDQGLIVIGMYHHKSPGPLSREHVRRLVEQYGFRFPVAIDHGWRTLKRWWLNGRERAWTSVSFLIDQQGLIRHVHLGGSYAEDEADTMEAVIHTLLAHPQPTSPEHAREGSDP